MSGSSNGIELPQEFLERMKLQLGDEYNAFIESYDKEAYRGLRINRFKVREREENGIFSALCKEKGAAALGGDEHKGTASKLDGSVCGFEDAISSIPWTETGYYYEEELKPGRNPLFDAGAYYIQEPSAMTPAELIDICPGYRVLDLCAAPGGKSTRLAERLFLADKRRDLAEDDPGRACNDADRRAGSRGEISRERGFLIANEYVNSRARILASNIERLGISNTVVLNESPDSLEEKFAGFFDAVLVDAPCSGEGMFRKNPETIQEWSIQNVEHCARRQRDILRSAYKMLKPGGCMIYSTCTFAPQENDENVSWFCGVYPDMELVNEEHIYPHRAGGEGHFVAKLLKSGSSLYDAEYADLNNDMGCGGSSRVVDSSKKNDGKKGKGKKGKSNGENRKSATDIKDACKAFFEFEKEYLKISLSDKDGRFELFGDRLFLVPRGMPSLEGIKCVCPGLELGTFKKNRFEPAHALSMHLAPSDAKICFELGNLAGSYIRGEVIEAGAYIHGEQSVSTDETEADCDLRIMPGFIGADGKYVETTDDAKTGWALMCVDGISVGWGKYVDGRIKNHYPKGLRRFYAF